MTANRYGLILWATCVLQWRLQLEANK